MRAELPWNVAGIPPEAREAARAAARREGLSVGEWLTRRILRSFSDLSEDPQPMAFERPLDSWGLPQSAAARRDTEDMLARVSRSENESSDAWRRIEEQLRGVARRLDSSERSQSENNRVLSRTASEMNVAAREQAQAFDQMGQSVVSISERLERLERDRAQDGLKDAVKALHQGLARVADQIGQTATQSANQVTQVTQSLEQLATQLSQSRADGENADRAIEEALHHGLVRVSDQISQTAAQSTNQVTQVTQNLEQLAGRLSQSRADGENADRAIEQALDQRLARVADQIGQTAARSADHVTQVAQSLDQLAAQIGQIRADGENADRAIEQRLAAVEKSAQFTTSALDHTLEKLEVQANQRASDQVEWQRRAGSTEEALLRLEESATRLERAGADHAQERRLDALEGGLTGLALRFDEYNPIAPVEHTLQALMRRVDSLEKKHSDLIDEMRANIAGPKPVFVEPTSHAPFEAPPFVEPTSVFGGAVHQEPDPFLPAYGTEAFAPDAFAAGAFAQDTFAQDTFAQDPFNDLKSTADPFAPLGDMVDPYPSEPQAENFLSAARRSAREAAEKSESENKGFLGNLRRRSAITSTSAEETKKSRLLLPLLVAAIVVAGVIAGIIEFQHLRRAAPPFANAPSPNHAALILTPQVTPVAPQTGTTLAESPAQHLAPPKTVKAVRLHPAPPSPAPIPQAASAQPAPPTPDHIAQLANGGNATAETILGLRALDGTDGTTANLSDASKWLSRAADQGQAVAQYRLGTMYERGQGVVASIATAAHWYELAANQGNRKAMHNLAVSYAQGINGKKNMAEAARWFARAAAVGLSDSQFNLAVLYERGDGVPQSLLDAYKWYGIAAAQGDAESKQRLDVLQTQLTDADRAAAQKSAAAFQPTPLNRAANVPPEPTDLPNN